MPRKPQQSRSRATVAAIVEAGFIAMSRHGLEGTTTRHIADIAGISVGSLYEYFANKEAVYDAMYERVVADIVAMIRPLTPELVKLDIRDAVHELLREFRDLLMRDDGRYLHYASYAMQLAQREHLAPLNRILTELMLQYAVHHPELLRIQRIPALSYIIINGGVFSVIRHLSEPNPVIRFEDLADGLVRMVDHCIQGELRASAGDEPSPAPE